MEGQTDETMTTGKRTNNDLKSQHKQIQIEQHEQQHKKPVVKSDVPERSGDPVPLVALPV